MHRGATVPTLAAMAWGTMPSVRVLVVEERTAIESPDAGSHSRERESSHPRLTAYRFGDPLHTA